MLSTPPPYATIEPPTIGTAKRGILADIAASIFEPGVNKGLLVFMHFAFISLIGSLLLLLWMTNGLNIHVWILTIISFGLYAIVTWYYSILALAILLYSQFSNQHACIFFFP